MSMFCNEVFFSNDSTLCRKNTQQNSMVRALAFWSKLRALVMKCDQHRNGVYHLSKMNNRMKTFVHLLSCLSAHCFGWKKRENAKYEMWLINIYITTGYMCFLLSMHNNKMIKFSSRMRCYSIKPMISLKCVIHCIVCKLAHVRWRFNWLFSPCSLFQFINCANIS